MNKAMPDEHYSEEIGDNEKFHCVPSIPRGRGDPMTERELCLIWQVIRDSSRD
jgi:hypothetical protein